MGVSKTSDDVFVRDFQEQPIGSGEPDKPVAPDPTSSPPSSSSSPTPRALSRRLDYRQLPELSRPERVAVIWSVHDVTERQYMRFRIIYEHTREDGQVPELTIHAEALAREMRDRIIGEIRQGFAFIEGSNEKAFVTVLGENHCVFGLDLQVR